MLNDKNVRRENAKHFSTLLTIFSIISFICMIQCAKNESPVIDPSNYIQNCLCFRGREVNESICNYFNHSLILINQTHITELDRFIYEKPLIEHRVSTTIKVMDVDPDNKDIYFLHNNLTLGTKISKMSREGTHYMDVLNLPDSIDHYGSMTIDWATKIVYYTYDNTAIYARSLNDSSSKQKLIKNNLSILPKSLKAHQYRGQLFWLSSLDNNTNLEWIDKNGSEGGIFLTSDMQNAVTIVIDSSLDNLCWFSKTNYIYCVHIENQIVTDVGAGESKHIFDLEVFDNNYVRLVIENGTNTNFVQWKTYNNRTYWFVFDNPYYFTIVNSLKIAIINNDKSPSNCEIRNLTDSWKNYIYREYLHKFGYLDSPKNKGASEITRAVSEFQALAEMTITGELNNEIKNLLKLSKCELMKKVKQNSSGRFKGSTKTQACPVNELSFYNLETCKDTCTCVGGRDMNNTCKNTNYSLMLVNATYITIIPNRVFVEDQWTIRHNISGHIADFDVDPQNKEVYFLHNDTQSSVASISIVSYESQDRKNDRTFMQLPNSTDHYGSIAVDWISKNIFYTWNNDSIYVTRLDEKKNTRILAENLSILPKTLKFHPGLGKLFWLSSENETKLEWMKEDGTDNDTFLSAPEINNTVDNLVIDYLSDKLCWYTELKSDFNRKIYCAGIHDKKISLIAEEKKGYKKSAVAVLHDNYVWLMSNSDNGKIQISLKNDKMDDSVDWVHVDYDYQNLDTLKIAVIDENHPLKTESWKNYPLYKYLYKFGYLSSDIFSNISTSDVRQAISDYQSYNGLTITGKMDDETKKQMEEPRCGVTDKITQNSSHRSKRHIQKVKTWLKFNLTYKIVQYSKKLSDNKVKKAIADAFKMWSNHTVFTFTEESTASNVDIKISFVESKHGDRDPFDGPGQVLAHAYFPKSGKAHFDDSEEWTVDEEAGVNLFQTALHEFGHLLGLDHISDNKNAVMAPYSQPYNPNFTIHTDDLKSLKQLYNPNVTRFVRSEALNLLMNSTHNGKDGNFSKYKTSYAIIAIIIIVCINELVTIFY